MELSHQDVLEILELLERSNVDYLELEQGETRLVADRTGTVHSSDAAAVRPSPPAPAPAVRADVETGTEVTPATQPEPEIDGLVSVTAPVVGVFYRSPEPGAAPFTEVGQMVTEQDTVGLVEVMKMFNSVTAAVRGRVVEILVENEAFVEFGQPLMTIQPNAGG